MSIISRDPLAERSLRVLRDGQAPSGAFVASPSFRVYDFGWLRDGTFCAYALERAGDHAAAAAFHRWVVSTIARHAAMADSAIARVQDGEVPPSEAMLPARFTLAGRLEEPDPADPWPNFQVDGYGMWLWSFEDHLRGRALEPDETSVVRLVARYLAVTWPLKCCSCWEELQDGEHASTIAAVYAGLAAAARLLSDPSFQDEAERVREHLLTRFAVDGRLGRSPDQGVDASMVWLSVPFDVLPADDPRLVATIDAIKRDLIGPSGGVYRYLGDTYYGGGEWLLLASSLAWHDTVAGGGDGEELRQWVRGQATGDGDLPEQVTSHAQEPGMVEPWVERWGPVANPLLWSHAMFLVSEDAAR